MIGAGGMARGWIRRFFPNFAQRSELVALVDVSRSDHPGFVLKAEFEIARWFFHPLAECVRKPFLLE